MVGTLRALQRPIALLSKEVAFVASDAALDELTKKSIGCHTLSSDINKVFEGASPEIVLAGVSAFERGHEKWSGLELNYVLSAMGRGIPPALYRDATGIAKWAAEAAQHPRAGELLHFLMFDNLTVEIINRRGWSCRSVVAVGSAYYDDLAGYDVERDRRESRAAVGLDETDTVILVNPGASSPRVLEMLEPTLEALANIKRGDIVLLPTFHPKDKDAPFVL